ncbi:MAG: lipopolysaccharide biosynthesis protein [Promethearchaeota archaeon]
MNEPHGPPDDPPTTALEIGETGVVGGDEKNPTEDTGTWRPPPRRTDIFKEAGQNRAVVSGTYNMIFSVVASLVLWMMMIVGSGSNVIAYYALGGATYGILAIVSSGFSQSYVALVKEDLVKDPARALETASIFTRFMFLYGLVVGTGSLVAGILVTDDLYKYVFLFGAPAFYINLCVRDVMIWNLQVANRYDLTGFLGAFWGLINVSLGIWFILAGWAPRFFPLVGTVSSLVQMPIVWHYFRKYASFELRDLFTKTRLIRNPRTGKVLKYSVHTLLSNMESFQLVSNVNVFAMSLSLAIFYPEIKFVGTSLLGIINIYAQLKCALLYFASPLNVELAEAYAKGDHDMIEETINHSARYSILVGFGIISGFCGLSALVLRELHGNFFLTAGGSFDADLFHTAWVVLLLMMVGQGGFGVACLFANALIGTENARISAKVYVGALATSVVLTPLFIVGLNLKLMGIAFSTLIVGVATMLAMALACKRALGVHYDLRLPNLLPLLFINFLVLFLFSSGFPTGLTFLDVAIGLGVVVVVFLLGLSFLGVFRDENDWALLGHLYRAFGMGKYADGFVKFSQKIYYLNPLHHPETPQ